MLGGNGNVYIIDNRNDLVVESSRSGVDAVRSTTELTLAANIENLLLKGGRDIDGTGNALSNVIRGDSGDNTLRGLDGNDLLDGGAGNDRLIGGGDKDRLLGGARRDVMTDCDRSEDRIDLRSSDARTRSGGNQEFDFIGLRGFTRDAGGLRFSGGILSVDVNGYGRADFKVTLTGVTGLAANDRVL